MSSSGSLSFAARGASLSLGQDGTITSTLGLFLGAAAPPSPMAPAFSPLPEAHGLSPVPPTACSPLSLFLFDEGFRVACSFDNSGR